MAIHLKSLISNVIYKIHTHKIIRNALYEDIPKGRDITSYLLIKHTSKSIAEIIAKQDAVLCGVDIARDCFKVISPLLKAVTFKKDGDKIYKGDVILKVEGNTRAILKAERTALNFLQHLSGISTNTYQMVSIAGKYNVEILDTRKTIPGLRYAAKYAVAAGGGKNHRFHLCDDVLIKENHILANDGIEKTLIKFEKKYKKPFEIEVENLDEFKIALKYKVPFIMLDDFSISDIKKAVKLNNGQAKLEVSGGVNMKNIKKIAKTGINYISSGYLTHSVPAVDFSLLFRPNN